MKKLTVKEFNDKFGCDVVEMIRRQLASSSTATAVEHNDDEDGGTTSSGKKRNRVMGMQQRQFSNATSATSGLSLKTPAVGRFGGGRPPMTIARTARKGESLIVQ